jgi:hypothetical protein
LIAVFANATLYHRVKPDDHIASCFFCDFAGTMFTRLLNGEKKRTPAALHHGMGFRKNTWRTMKIIQFLESVANKKYYIFL